MNQRHIHAFNALLISLAFWVFPDFLSLSKGGIFLLDCPSSGVDFVLKFASLHFSFSINLTCCRIYGSVV